MHIRPFQREDAAALHWIFVSAVREVGSRHYSEQQVRVWSESAADAAEYLERAQDGRLILVAADEHDVPVAYIDLEPDGHIDHLFCRPDHVGQGVASALYQAVEQAAIARGIATLHVEASEGARPVFLRKGFTQIGRNDFDLEGVPIHNYAMTKSLGK